MSEFFTTPPSIPTVTPEGMPTIFALQTESTDVLRQRAIEARQASDQEIIDDQAAKLSEGIDYAYTLLADAEASGTPKLPMVDVISRRAFEKKAVSSLVSKVTDMGDGRNYHWTDVVAGQSKGWVLTQVTTREGTNAVVLMNDGSIALTGAVKENKNKDGETIGSEVTAYPGKVGDIDLTAFPYNPKFNTQKGFCDSHNNTAGIVKAGFVKYDTPEAYVAMNIERISTDLRVLYERHLK